MVPQTEGIDWRELYSRGNIKLFSAIFLLALLSRIIFLSVAPQIPVVWDARIYASAGLGLLDYVENGGDGQFARGSGDGEDFKNCYLKYLDGEDIEWLYYKPPTMAESQKYLFYSGPVYPAIMAAIFSMKWDNDFQVIRHFNALIDSLTIVIISMLAYILWRKRWAVIVVAVIQLTYWPLVLTCGLLTLETITSFFISLLFLSLSLFYYNKNKLLVFVSGLIAGLLFLTKPTAALLSAPVYLFMIYAFGRERKTALNSILLFTIGMAIFAVPWTILTSDYYNQFAIRDPEYASANFRSSSAIEFEGYDLDYTDSDFWTYPLFDRIRSQPMGYGQLLLKKLIRLWWTPHDEFWQGPKQFEIILHRSLVLMALFGMMAMIYKKKKLLFLPCIIILYYTLLHTVFHSVPRYNFNALPGLFLVATHGLVFGVNRLRQMKLPKLEASMLIGLAAALIFINLGSVEKLLISFLPAYFWMTLTFGLVFTCGILVVRLFFGDKSQSKKIWIWMPIILLTLTSMVGWSREHLSEWSIAIDDPETILVTEITMPADFSLADDDRVRLAIDMTSHNKSGNSIAININGLKFRFNDAVAPVDKSFYSKGSYGALERIMSLDKGSLRWYRMIDIDPGLIRVALGEGSKLNISIALNDTTGQSYIRLYGDYGTTDQSQIMIPSFAYKSIERFKELGDRRIYEECRLSSVSTKSYIVGDGQLCHQLPGRMRLFLVVSGSDFTRTYY